MQCNFFVTQLCKIAVKKYFARTFIHCKGSCTVHILRRMQHKRTQGVLLLLLESLTDYQSYFDE